MRQAKESDDQKALAQILDTLRIDGRPLLWMHPPNEGQRNPAYAAELKRRGVKPGVPDVLIFDPPPKFPGYRGTAIELKRIGGKATISQFKWLEHLEDRAWAVAVVRGIDEAMDYLRQCGYMREVG